MFDNLKFHAKPPAKPLSEADAIVKDLLMQFQASKNVSLSFECSNPKAMRNRLLAMARSLNFKISTHLEGSNTLWASKRT